MNITSAASLLLHRRLAVMQSISGPITCYRFNKLKAWLVCSRCRQLVMRKGNVCLMPLTDLSTIRVGQLRTTAICCGPNVQTVRQSV